MTIKNGDMPAMPVQELGQDGNPQCPACYGLTKREMFAMHMMAANRIDRNYLTWSDAARDAIDMADALLAELEQTK